MFSVLRLSLFILTVVSVAGAVPVSAAQVVCLAKWNRLLDSVPVDLREDPAGHVQGNPARRLVVPDAVAKWWPSGDYPDPDSCYVGLITGPIEKGDYAQFKKFLTAHYRYMYSVHLVSRGGDVEEAIKIGRLLRKYLLHSQAPSMFADNDFWAYGYPPSTEHPLCKGPKCRCASACALIWFGAVDRLGAVGLHRPKITDPQFSALPPDEASKRYKDALKAVSMYLEEVL
jgi:hypothetical protein